MLCLERLTAKMNPLNIHILYRKIKFLETSNAFLLVNFLASPQVNFVRLKEILFKKKLTLKVIRSRAILPLMNKVIKGNLIHNLKNIPITPTFVIQSLEQDKKAFLSKLLSLDFAIFMKYKMNVLACFSNGIVYSKSLLFNFNYAQLYFETASIFYIIFIKLVIFSKIKIHFLLKLLCFYEKTQIENK
jgi:hypothetical protein